MNGSILLVGDRVTLHSLKTTVLNGKKGVLKFFVKAEGRWAVKIDGDKSLKTIKPENLKPQDTVAVVVIPVDGDMYYHDLPARSLQGWTQALYNLVEYRQLSSRFYHYYYLPNQEIGWMTVEMPDLFYPYPVNRNMEQFGWTGQKAIHGTVVVSFSDDGHVTHFEPYSMDIVRILLVELFEARTPGHPTRTRIASGGYHHLPLMPGVMSHNDDGNDDDD